VVIVGAGAAGLATAVFAARAAGGGGRILVLDGARKPGAKILVSGGGRCNVTNRVVEPEDFFGGSPHAIRRVLRSFTPEGTVEFFAELGVTLHEEEFGKLFPDSHSARTVLDALVGAVGRLGVALVTNSRVTDIRPLAEGFELATSLGSLRARRVVLATGGQSLPKSGSDGSGYELARRLGHSIVPTTPALVPLILDGSFHRPLAGISHDVELTLRADGRQAVRMAGPMLWTHFGISGPAAMNISRCWHRGQLENRRPRLSASFIPGESFESAERRALELAARQPRNQLQGVLATLLPARLAEAVLRELRIPPRVTMAHLAREDRRRLIKALLDWPLIVRDSRGYNFAEATAGGVPLTEIDPASMASRRCPGLFLVGEILDVDGRIGGFNFQWAWAGGHVAGRAIADELKSDSDSRPIGGLLNSVPFARDES